MNPLEPTMWAQAVGAGHRTGRPASGLAQPVRWRPCRESLPPRDGFTLIELLIVVAIIGILAAIAIPNFQQAQLRARVARAQAEMRNVDLAYREYHTDTLKWPAHIDGDPAQHRAVTTPVAYLTTSVRDVFQPPKQLKNDSTFENVSRGQYHAEPAAIQYPTMVGMSKVYASQHVNAAYFVWSFGPDLDHEGAEAQIYDPSNGIRSNGDIYRPVNGERNKYFPYTAELLR